MTARRYSVAVCDLAASFHDHSNPALLAEQEPRAWGLYAAWAQSMPDGGQHVTPEQCRRLLREFGADHPVQYTREAGTS